MKFKESALAHKYLDGLSGIEIGGSAHNAFGLNTRNIAYTAAMDTIFKKAEIDLCGEALPVDIVAPGDTLPLPDNSVDFVISSHMIEHLFDPLKAMAEWLRVIKPGGFVFTIVPRAECVPDENRPTTPMDELMDRFKGVLKPENVKLHGCQQPIPNKSGLPPAYRHEVLANHETGHFTVFDLTLQCEVCQWAGFRVVDTQAIDDKVGNGFTVVAQKPKVARTPYGAWHRALWRIRVTFFGK